MHSLIEPLVSVPAAATRRKIPTTDPVSRFSDGLYLRGVLLFLARSRRRCGWSVRTMARRAGLRESVILLGEKAERIPNSTELKQWTRGLGIDCETIWSSVLPSR